MTGIADIFALANQYDTTTGHINNLTSKYVLLCVRIHEIIIGLLICVRNAQLEYLLAR